MTQITGDLGFNMATNMFSTFVQDDWQIAPTVKVLYGLRYDLYQVSGGPGRRAARADARASTSTRTTSGRALGVAWAVNPTDGGARAARASCTTRPILGGYEQALQFSGSPQGAGLHVQRRRCGAGAPRVSQPGCEPAPLAMQSPWAVDPDFQVAHTWQANAQLERAFGKRLHGIVSADVREGRQPAGRDRRQPDQPDRRARRRPPNLQHRGERGDAPRSALQPHQRGAVDRRLDVQGGDASGVEAPRRKG